MLQLCTRCVSCIEMKEDLLTSIFRRSRSKLKATAGRYLDAADVDDALQDAFVKLWGRRRQLDSESAAEGVAVTTVKNVSIDALRRRSATRFEDVDTSPQAALTAQPDDDSRERDELYATVSGLIDSRLSTRDRQILYMRDRDGWEFDEIAKAMSLSEANVRVIISRARKTIRQIYKDNNNI